MFKLFEKFENFKNKDNVLWKYFSEESSEVIEQWNSEKIKQYQLETFQQLFKHAINNSPFYKKKFKEFEGLEIKDFGDISKLPMTTKEEVRECNLEFLACKKEDLGQIHISTGTSGGKPVFEFYSYEDLFLADILPEYKKLMPLGPEDEVLVALPLEMSSSGMSFTRLMQFQKGATVIPAGKGGAYSTVEKTLQFIECLPITSVITTPTYAAYIAEKALEDGFDISTQTNINYIWITGEGCSDALRKRIEKLWGASVRFFYGSMEAGQIGIECSKQKYYHILSQHCLVEIIDEKTKMPVKDGEIGEIVITPLLHTGQPLIRYRTKDRGQIVVDKCCSEINLPLLRVYGREENQVFGKFSPFFIEEILLRFPQVSPWYQIIEKQDSIEIDFEPAVGQMCDSEAVKTIQEKLESMLKVPCTVKQVPVKSLERPSKKMVRVKRKD